MPTSDVLFGNGAESAISRINRVANRSGLARIAYKGQLVTPWFRKHFGPGDAVHANVIDRNTIELPPGT